MGVLVPQDYPLALITNRDERLVVEALCDRLSDGWRVFPNVSMSGQRDYEIDIVIAHPEHGIAVIEVKGHRASLRSGLWCSNGQALEPQPFAQAKNNAYELRARLRSSSPELAHLRVEYAVAFPNSTAIRGLLPQDVDRAQLILGPDLDDPADAIDRLMSYRWGNTAIGVDGLRCVADIIRPDADLAWDPESQARLARSRLETICANQVRALERLDANRKVIVTGGAGSGKTRLAMAWTRRALVRHERTLLTCFNIPLADAMAERLPDDDHLTVGAFYDVALGLDGMPDLDVPDGADAAFWEQTASGHLQRNWPKVTQRFDTIVIDEAQDFYPGWLAQLQSLLDPTGPRRILMVADESQALYPRGFTVPSKDDGWLRCELVNNCRNTYQIAALLRRHLGGSPAPVGGPDSECLSWREANDVESALDVLGEEIDRIVDGEGHDPRNVLVMTPHRSLRDVLREGLALVEWEGREPAAIMCETVHRTKGLEFDYVIYVGLDNDETDEVLYVGLSRAVVGLSVIGPSSLARRVGLA